MTYKIETVVNDIKARAKQLGLSNNQLYKLTGVSQTTFQRWCSGNGSARISTLDKITTALDEYESSHE